MDFLGKFSQNGKGKFSQSARGGVIPTPPAPPTPTITNTIYISSSGNDSDDGTEFSPWQNLDFALNQILDASPTNNYCIKFLSSIVAETVTLKPCVNLDFSGFTLDADEFVLDPAWNTVFSGVINLYVTHGVINLSNASVLDFTLFSSQPALLSFFDVKITNSLEFVGTGAQTLNLKDVGNTAEPLNIKIQDFSGAAISGGLIGNLDLINKVVSDGMTAFIVAEVVTGNISLISAEFPLVGFFLGAFTFSQISGDGAQVVVYTSTTLVQYPTMINGAHWYPIQVNSLQNTLYVSTFGSDDQGDGTSANAYKTIFGALTSQRISNATPENPVDIVVFGRSEDLSMPALPPNVNIVGVGNASTLQYVEINSAAWQTAPENSKNLISNFNSPGFFCNCISPSFTPILNLKNTVFSVGYFANCDINIESSNIINNPLTSNLITFQNATVESKNNFYNTTEFLIQNGVINFKNDLFYQNLVLSQGSPIIYFLNSSQKSMVFNATQETIINADRNFSVSVNFSDSAKLIPIANTVEQSSAVAVTTGFSMSAPLPIHLRVNMLSSGQIIYLPACKTVDFPTLCVGARVYIETDTLSQDYEIRYQDDTTFQIVAAGTAFYLVVNNNSSENGEWDVINDAAGSATGTETSYALAIFNQDISGSSTSGGIAFSDTSTYLPLIIYTAPATYSLANLFSVENDGNLHTILRCQDPAGGTYLLTFNLVLSLINYTSLQSFFINFGINGFSSVNIDPKKDFPIKLYGNLDKDQIPVTYTCLIQCAFNDVIYAPVIRSGGSTSAFDTYLKALYYQVAAVKCGDFNLGVSQESYSARQNLTSSYVITTPVPFHIYVNMLSSSQTIKLPVCNVGGAPTIAVGTRIYFETSASSFAYVINYADSSLFFNASSSSVFYAVLNDNTTSNGLWDFIPVTQTVNGLYGLTKIGYDYTTSTIASVSMQANRVYINAYTGGQAVFTAPSSPADKTIIGVYGVTGASTAGWKVNAAFGQKFQFATDVGANSGSLTSTAGSFGDGFEAVFDTTSSTWIVTKAIGNNLTVI